MLNKYLINMNFRVFFRLGHFLDITFRKPLLYPAELPPQNVIKIYFKRFFDPRKFTLITRSCNPSFGQNPNLGNLR